MPDITSSQVSLDQRATLPPGEDLGSVQAIITRGWNAYLLQVVLVKNGETRMLLADQHGRQLRRGGGRCENACGHARCALGEGRSGFEVASESRKLLIGSRGPRLVGHGRGEALLPTGKRT